MEILIAVIIIGILSAIALPAYQRNVDRAARADVSGVLIGLASSMERRFSENGHYCDNAQQAGGTGVNNCGVAAAGAVGFDEGAPLFYAAQAPVDGIANYTITIDTVTPTSFTLQATRTGRMVNDECGDFTLTHTGDKQVINNVLARGDCWN